MELVTLASTKAWLKVSGTADDTIITMLIESAEKQLRSICNRSNGASGWINATQTEFFDGEDSEIIQLRFTPITAASLVVTIDDVVTPSTSYVLDAATGLLQLTGSAWNQWGGMASFSSVTIPRLNYRSNGFGVGVRAVKAVYTGGYVNAAAVPENLIQAVYMLVEYAYLYRGQAGLLSEGLGSYNYTRGPAGYADLVKDVRTLVGATTSDTLI